MTDDGYFDAGVARTYDQRHGDNGPDVIDRIVSVLSEFAGSGEILEFAIGSGRIALPLAAKGHIVKGIELSRPMVAELQKKTAGVPLQVHIGDMATSHMPGAFSLVYLVFNTINNLTTQEQQIACFANAADHLVPGGRFLIETQVPPLQRLPFGETKLAFASSPTHLGVSEIDVATQTYRASHIWTEDGAYQSLSIPFRYAWPAELDLMARLAGLQLEHRWSDWDKAVFDRNSGKHVSIWQKL